MVRVPSKGKLVVRGRDWKWGNQDGGEGSVGIIVADNGATSRVQWTNGHSNSYRTGAESGKYDLLTIDASKAGIVHEGVFCDTCPGEMSEKSYIKGIRWKCSVCRDFDVCNPCYMNGEHDLGHPFRRCDFPFSLGCFVGARAGAATLAITRSDIPFRSVHIGHLERLGSPHKVYVVRGPDWRWSDQDQGEGNVGIISEKRNKLSRPQWLAVAWLPSKEEKNIYRAGAEQKRDLRLLDSRQLGSEHSDYSCSACDERPIKGIRWQCADCENVHLCSGCYMEDKHSLSHKFQRFCAPVGKGSKCRAREGSKKVTLKNKPSWYTAKSYYVDHLPTVNLWENMIVFGTKKTNARRAIREDPQAVPGMKEIHGKIFIGPFVVLNTITDKIGQGQFGTVYRGYCCQSRRTVAVKEIRVPTDAQKELAMAEIKHLQAFQKHEHMVSLMKYGFYNEAFWIVMEHCNMGDLQSYVLKYRPDEVNRIEFMVQMASAVDFIHRMDTPMIHRDLKPANILLCYDDSDRPVVKVADFGLSKIIHSADAVKTAMLTATSKAGTPYYMGPEVWAQRQHITPAVDIFSLGLLFYGCLEAKRNRWDLYPDMLAGDSIAMAMAGLGQRLIVPLPFDINKAVRKHDSDSEPVKVIKELIIRMVKEEPGDRPKSKEVFEVIQDVFAPLIDKLSAPPKKPVATIPELPEYTPPADGASSDSDNDSDSETGSEGESDDDGGGLGYQLLRSAMAAGLREDLAQRGGGSSVDLGAMERLVKEMPLLELLFKGAAEKSTSSERVPHRLSVGTHVIVEAELSKVKKMQEGHGGYVDSMAQFCGQVGVVDERILHVVSVKFPGGHVYRYNPALLTPLEDDEAVAAVASSLSGDVHMSQADLVGSLFKKFDVVRICEEPSVLEHLQTGHGGWNSKMKLACGLKALVNRVDDDGDVFVECINGHDWWINPEAMVKTEPLVGPIEAGDFVLVMADQELVKQLQKGHGEWCSDMRSSLGHTGIVKQVLSGDRMRVEVRNYKWIFNTQALQLVAKSEEMLVALVKRRFDGALG